MTLYIGTDRAGKTHAVSATAREKACGHQIAICGREVLRSQTTLDEAMLACDRCLRAYERGDQYVLEQNATQDR